MVPTSRCIRQHFLFVEELKPKPMCIFHKKKLSYMDTMVDIDNAV